ncbi:hypothetical protein SAMN05428642_101139 [Flaviramulus basaltis]|uniref:Glycine dehydrogenase n=1 Tax=Flaviramulus basaltis TaxID=369401 RepID=A0A1K2IA92_9FLAO|nr:hypothetical protein SAMN05428642_101139 [Flaviramulus basaltis]
MFIPCNEANHVCDKTQYKESTLWEKIKLNLHLIYCKACRKYTKSNSKLTHSIKVSNVECMDKKCKEAMKKNFEKALKDQINQ